MIQEISVLPHASSAHDKITDHELVPTGKMGISHYIFDERTYFCNYGSRNKFKMSECTIQTEIPISLYQTNKRAHDVIELLMKRENHVTAKSYCQAVSTKAIGLLMNLDAKRSSENRIIALFKAELDIVTYC